MTASYNNSVGVGIEGSSSDIAETAAFVPGGSDRALLVLVQSSDGSPSNVAEVRIGGAAGTPLVQLGSYNNFGTYFRNSLWVLETEPANTSQTIYVRWVSAQGERLILAESLQDAGLLFGALSQGIGNNTTAASLTGIAAAVGELVVDFCGIGSTGAGRSVSPATGQTERLEVATAPVDYDDAAVADLVAASTSNTRSWTIAPSFAGYGMFALSIPNAGGGGAAPSHSEIASRRNRPGRGPYSLGRYFRPRMDAYTSAQFGVLAGSSAITITPSATLRAVGRLAGSVALAFVPAGTVRAVGVLAGSVPLTVTPAADLNASGRVAGAVALVISPTATARAGGTLLGTAAIVITPAGTLNFEADNAISGAAALVFTASADLNALARLTGASTIAVTPAGTLRATGGALGSSTLTLALNGDLNALARLLGTASVALTPTADLNAVGRVAGTSSLAFTLAGALAGVGGHALSGSVNIALSPSGVLTARGELDGSTTLTFTPAGDLNASGRVAGGINIAISAAGEIEAIGRLSGSVPITITPTASSFTTLRGTAQITLSASGALRATGSLAGIAQLAIALAGNMTDQGAQSVPNSVQTLIVLLANSNSEQTLIVE